MKTTDPLVGKFFHSREGERIVWQGQFLKRISPDAYLVQLFSWAMGEPSDQLIVSTANMNAWIVYDDADVWRERGDATFAVTKRRSA